MIVLEILPFFLLTDAILAVLVMLVIFLLILVLKELKELNVTTTWIWELLKKFVVTVTVVSVNVEAASYKHGDTVNISGNVSVDEAAQANTSVSINIKDSAENSFDLPDATTDADGKFTASWVIPPEVAPGVITVTATALGMTATTTFTFNQTKTHIQKL